MATIFIIDHSGRISTAYDDPIRSLGHSLLRVTVAEALGHPRASAADIVFLDARLPDMEVVDALRALRTLISRPEVIVVNSPGDPEEAERTIKNGAWDYIDHPPSFRALSLLLSRVLSYRVQRSQVLSTPRTLTFAGVEGSSPAMTACLALAAQASNSDANVLIIGETGVGKELLAAAIHTSSPRAGGNFVVVDCAAIPESLAESTLLGHDKGAFTGAQKPHIGLVKQADGGTLFLDEVSEIPLSIQKVFLRVLDERRFRPVGGKNEVTSDFRIIAASNRDLQAMVQKGEFRRDLLFRIRGFTIELPPLRDRIEDIEGLVRHYVPLLCVRMGLEPKAISADFVGAVKAYAWPGNVRELINAIERSVVAARAEPTIFPVHLPTYIRAQMARNAVAERRAQTEGTPPEIPVDTVSLQTLQQIRDAAIESAERKYLVDLVRTAGHDVSAACRISGLSRSRLYALLKKYSIRISAR